MERRRLGFGAAALGSISLIALEAISCGGGNEGNTTPVRPTSSPEGSPTATKTIEASPSAIATATQIVEITPTAQATEIAPTATAVVETPTKEPPSPTVEAIPTEEPAPTVDELIALVDQAVATLPPSDDLQVNVQVNVHNLPNAMAVVEDDPRAYAVVINKLGGPAEVLVKYACDNPENQLVGQAWVEMRAFVKAFASKYVGENGVKFYIQSDYKIPEGCTHPALVPYKDKYD